jgi:hypothetical protein
MTRAPPRYLDRPDQWDALATLLKKSVAGLDSEFYNCDLSRNSTETTTGRAIVHVWSVALSTRTFHPRGYHLAQSYVLPAAALFHQGLQDWLCGAEYEKWAHNKGMEIHAIENTWRLSGVQLRVLGVRDTLSLARWVHPARVVPGQGGYALDQLGLDLLDRGKTEGFEEILSVPNVVSIERRKTNHRNVCECGAVPCRRRGTGHVRSRVTTVDRWNEDVVRGTRLLPLDSVGPGHELWERLVAYSGVDAELAIELKEKLLAELKERPLPW